ncbi:hypothetical protein [Edaphobacillus lindanitolerans]|uniref:Uncharacterized protein n=1 Tax=Edaphobacillus lindanitolerans TaxID=550447 RepID=A0A1U7PL75_9BACI|nr:hypothetical protein [Edaphobacillus lindanitolerans]SIT87324.1 hypothetical protein SAMN05428946_2067 [Edaphobacillus lindanitolerans]
MKIEIAKHERMSESGSSLLRLIQNEDMPLLDLLIREAVQNSLDAGKSDAGHVNVDIGVKRFEAGKLAEEMEGIKETLTRRYPGEFYSCIYVEDSNTSGLTGPLSVKDVVDNDFGNFQKLVYEISKPQRQEGAGGSWGLGKTIYFRLGIGLVFYYTRIQKEDGTYEHRLAATMVENEEEEHSIIPPAGDLPKRGIAWWGSDAGDGSTLPITNGDEIKKVLDIFGIELFSGKQTGTKIIIPFTDEEELLRKTIVEGEPAYWWNESIEDYLKVSFQRWYAPRMDNQKYKYGNYLKASVNKEEITRDRMEIVFKALQDLYNSGAGVQPARSSYSEKIKTEKIPIRKDFVDTDAGGVAFVKLSMTDLEMLPPNNNPSPYAFLNIHDKAEAGNYPVICYTRKPGMIVNYETSGQWLINVENTGGNEYLLAIYVPNSELKMKSSSEMADLESYLRKGEKADHTAWFDIQLGGQRTNIVDRIRKGVSKRVAEGSNLIEKKTVSKKSRLGSILGRQLMPPSNFGKKASGGGGGTGGGGTGGNSRKTGFVLSPDVIYENDHIVLSFELFMKKPVVECTIELNVSSETGLIKGRAWEQEIIQKKFPFEIAKIANVTVNGKEEAVLSGKGGGESSVISEIIRTDGFNTPIGFIVARGSGDSITVTGEIKILKLEEGLELAITPHFTEA